MSGGIPRWFPPNVLPAREPAPPAAGRIKDDPEALIWPEELGDGRRAIVKMYRRRGAFAFARERLLHFRVQREFEALTRLAERSVPCTVPLAWGYGRSEEHGRYELLATLEIRGATSARELAAADPGASASLDLGPLFRCVRRMHEGGVFHGALKLHNVLAVRAGGNEHDFYLIDMPHALLFRGSIVGTPMADFDLLRLASDAARILGPTARIPLGEYGLDEDAQRALHARTPGFRASKGARARIRARALWSQAAEHLGVRSGPPSAVARLEQNGSVRVRLASGLGAALALAAFGAWRYYRPPGACVPALVETVPVPNARDAADDMAIWVDARDPSASRIIGTDKKGGLCVYDLGGAELQRITNGEQNNVDLRDGVPLPGGPGTLVVTSAVQVNAVFVYRVDAATGRLEPLESSNVALGLRPSGICLYRGKGGRTYCFVNGEDLVSGEEGVVEQWELTLAPDGSRMTAERVRRFAVGGRAEGCVCDDDNGFLFVSEEKTAVWRYGAEPDAGTEREVLDRVVLRGHVRPDAEGIALVPSRGGGGFLIVSNQGSNDFTVYERRPPHAYRGRFRLAAGPGVDAVTHTDGIDACAAPLGARFPDGLFVAQDDDNDGANQDFKLASWRDIAAALELGR